MSDKALDLLNKSYLMQWVGNYEKSKKLIELAWSEMQTQEEFNDLNLIIKRENKIRALDEKNTSEINEDEQKESAKKNEERTREELILKQAQQLLSAADNHLKEGTFKDVKEENSILYPIVTSHSDRFSCLLVQSDLYKYEVRVAAAESIGWNTKSPEFEREEGIIIEIEYSNSHEIVVKVSTILMLGTIHFSSLGIGEATFYERYGALEIDTRIWAIDITKQLAAHVFKIEERY